MNEVLIHQNQGSIGKNKSPKFKSLETLSLDLGIPSLLNCADVNEILCYTFKELHEKYNITAEDFLKIKQYKVLVYKISSFQLLLCETFYKKLKKYAKSSLKQFE